MNPQTHFEVNLVLKASMPPAVVKLLQLLCTNYSPGLEFFLTHIPLPNQPFFGIKGWDTLFRETSVQFAPLSKTAFRLEAVGRTDLHEQDLGLFLRWLFPYLARSGAFVAPENLLYARSEIRPANRQWLLYRQDDESMEEKLKIDFVTRDNLLG